MTYKKKKKLSIKPTKNITFRKWDNIQVQYFRSIIYEEYKSYKSFLYLCSVFHNKLHFLSQNISVNKYYKVLQIKFPHFNRMYQS
jgi:hypothetical protein